MGTRRTAEQRSRGQALVELALVLPLFLMVLMGIIVIGIGIFYQQQLTNAAREGARFAVVHSASALCPTVSWLDPDVAAQPHGYYRCDAPTGSATTSWQAMVGDARTKVFGLPPTSVGITACWSGYWTKDNLGNWAAPDAPPPDETTTTYFRGCTIGGVDPRINASALPCPAVTSSSDDMASDLSTSGGANANQVTVYACYEWRPPLAGFLIIPNTVHLRAVVTQALEYQQ